MRQILIVMLWFSLLAWPASAQREDAVASYVAEHYGHAKAERYAPLIQRKAKKYHLDPLLIARLIRLESDFNPHELSGRDAMGLMQVRRGHARHGDDLYDPETNLEYGCRILHEYAQEFGGDMNRGLSAYLHGPIYVASRGVRRTRYSRRLLGE